MSKHDDQNTYKYEERFIAFIDILGFKESILSGEIEVEALIKTIEMLRSEASKKPYMIEKADYMVFLAGPRENNASDKFHSSKEISVFSDLIVVSCEVNNSVSILNNLHKILHNVYFLQEHLSYHSILIRGGISCGLLYHKGDICIGPALLRAYELEKSVARFPRVVIDPQLIEQDRFKGIIGRWPEYLEKYGDDLYFVTHFKPLKTFFDMYPEKDLEVQVKTRRHYIIETLYAYKLSIEKALKSNDPSTQEKGTWLKEQYHETVEYFEKFYVFTEKEQAFINLSLEPPPIRK